MILTFICGGITTTLLLWLGLALIFNLNTENIMFVSNDKYITPVLLKVFHNVVMILALVTTIITTIGAFTYGEGGVFYAVVIIGGFFVFALVWRVFCECILVLFSINNKLEYQCDVSEEND